MKKILILLLLISGLNSFAGKLEYYLPNGKLFAVGKTINEVSKEFFPGELLYSHSTLSMYDKNTEKGILSVYFRVFTDTPIFILASDPDINAFTEAINSFNLTEFFKSYKFEQELKFSISDHKLKKTHLYLAFGYPTAMASSYNDDIIIETITFSKPIEAIFEIRNNTVWSYQLK